MSHKFPSSRTPAGLEGSHNTLLDFALAKAGEEFSRLVRFSGEGGQLLVAATPGPMKADQAARTITGRLVPFGQTGNTLMGRFTFGPGSITTPADPGEVKLLVEHDQRQSVGFATRLWEEQDGLWGTFHVPPGDPDGDRALLQAANRVRDAFSVGVDLDAGTLERARRSRSDQPIKGAGALRENSLVSVPAFTGARVTDVAASSESVLVAAWHTNPNREDRTPMHTCQTCGAELLPGIAHTCQTTTAAAPAAPTVTQEQLQAAIGGLLGLTPAEAQATEPETPAAGPALTAGAATTQVVQEEATYTFDGQGPSFIRDAWTARQGEGNGQVEAAARLQRFGRELQDGGPVLAHMLRASHGPEGLATFAVETRATEPNVLSPNQLRADYLVRALDAVRPMMAKLRTIRLTDATPFKIPTEGEFSAVGDHTEGTAHVAEGDLSLGAVTISPGAISGAYRFSRELADASNPAIDAIAIRAMLRDYARKSEAKAAAALALQSDGSTAATRVLSIDTPAELRAEIINYVVGNGLVAAPDYIFMGSGFYTTHSTAVAGDGRPYFPPLNPTNAAGTASLRTLSMNVDSIPGLLTNTTVAAEAYMVRAEDVLVGESPTLTFRFDQPEGPGIIKLAIWGYVVARTLRNSGVRRLTTAAS